MRATQSTCGLHQKNLKLSTYILLQTTLQITLENFNTLNTLITLEPSQHKSELAQESHTTKPKKPSQRYAECVRSQDRSW